VQLTSQSLALPPPLPPPPPPPPPLEQEDKLKFAFMVFDEDGNGVITKAELVRILKANHMATSDAEVARKADTIMNQADKDGDGVITFDE
jgi:serine/threonine-protein phosphatase 2B regulatory subunit